MNFLLIPTQYAMGHSRVVLQDTAMNEPTLMWLLCHMPSGTRKSTIHSIVKNIIQKAFISEDINDFTIDNATFELIGLKMQSNNNCGMWFFDEGRSFFSQMKMYSNSASRNESTVLTLYNGKKVFEIFTYTDLKRLRMA